MRTMPPLCVAVVCLVVTCAAAADDLPTAGPTAKLSIRDRHVDYKPDLAGVTAYVRRPGDVAAGERLGVVVYVPPADEIDGVPDGWAAVLDERRLIFVGVRGAGNPQPVARRCGLAVAAAGRMMATAAVDPKRVYVAGFSGGARVAGLLGFYQPDLFRGTIQCCGADYFRRLQHASPLARAQAGGPLIIDAAEGQRAKRRVRFVLVTGDGDQAHDLMSDVYKSGFKRDGFAAELVDVPGRGHEPADGPTFAKAVAFLDAAGPAVLPARPHQVDSRRRDGD